MLPSPVTGQSLYLALLDEHDIVYPQNGTHADRATRPLTITRAARLFNDFSIYTLTMQERVQDAYGQEMVQALQTGAYVCDAQRQADLLGKQLTAADIEADPAWLNEGVILVCSNCERQQMSWRLARAFALRNNTPMLCWPRKFVGKTWESLNDRQRQRVRDAHASAWEFFVPNLPSVINENIKVSAGTRCPGPAALGSNTCALPKHLNCNLSVLYFRTGQRNACWHVGHRTGLGAHQGRTGQHTSTVGSSQSRTDRAHARSP